MVDLDNTRAQIEAENAAMTDIPTLDQLLARLALAPKELDLYFNLVASGVYKPLLQNETAILAAQAMAILFNHIRNKDGNPR